MLAQMIDCLAFGGISGQPAGTFSKALVQASWFSIWSCTANQDTKWVLLGVPQSLSLSALFKSHTCSQKILKMHDFETGSVCTHSSCPLMWPTNVLLTQRNVEVLWIFSSALWQESRGLELAVNFGKVSLLGYCVSQAILQTSHPRTQWGNRIASCVRAAQRQRFCKGGKIQKEGDRT